MMRLNLLPWREQRRKELDRRLMQQAAGALVLVLLVLLYLHMHMAAAIHRQQARNAFLQQAIAQMNAKISKIAAIKKTRSALLARMKVIQQLQADRMQIVHTFNGVARVVPAGVYLTRMAQTGEAFSFSGVAQSNEQVSQFMRNFAASTWFTNPLLHVIHVVRRGNERMSLFTLAVQGTNKLVVKTVLKRPMVGR
ncbi:MAG: PilN domain-containing protein [Acidiferrobacter sp.]